MRKLLATYVPALVLLGLALGVRVVLDPWLEDRLSHPTIFTAVLLTTWYFGTGPAIMNALLGYPAVEAFVFGGPSSHPHVHYILASLGLYLGLNTVIIVFVTLFRRERDRLRETERILGENEQRIRASFDNAALGIVETDGRDHFSAVNERICVMLGYSREELLGMSVHDLTAPEDRPQSDELNEKLRHGKLERLDYEKHYLRRDGSPMLVHVTVSPIRDESGRYLRSVGTVEDITERKRLEEELHASMARAKESAEEANRAKDHFLAVLSHELRTPLSPVLAAVQLMESQNNSDAQVRHYLGIIRRNLELQARLIDDLLDVARIARGKILLDRKRVDVRMFIERVVDVCRPDLQARKLRLALEMPQEACFISADASRLQQVFWNILKNSIKFTPEGGRITLSCRRQNDQVAIEVRDTGTGIEPECIPHIFNAFEQGSQRVTQQFGGLGLGLAISKRLVEMHEGTISAQSEGRNRGSTLTVLLPLLAAQAEAGAQITAHKVFPVPRRTAGRILLVEDHGDTALMMQLLLESAGYEVKTAADVRQALDIANSHPVDVLISDLGLPGRSGLDLIMELRSRGSKLKAIALSGFGREEDVLRSKEAGFSCHLTKPVNLDTLVRTVDSLVHGSSS